jgi:hypothetical protein
MFVALLGVVLFSLDFVLIVAVWSSLLMAGVATRGVSAVQRVITAAATTIVTLAVVAAILEAALRSESMGRLLGTPKERAAWNSRYDHLWESNIFGFRSPWQSVTRRPNLLRVLALGDSYTWGDKIARSDSTWPAALERRLAKRHAAGPVEVIDMGQRGFTTANEAELLRRLGWQFAPDLVVVQFLVNDALPSDPGFQHKFEDWLCPYKRLVPERFRVGKISRSALLSFLEGAMNLKMECWQRYIELYTDKSLGWEQAKHSFKEIADSARAHSAPVVVVLFPLFIPGTWTEETYPLRMLHDLVARRARAYGMHSLDLVPVFAAKAVDWRTWWATPYDSHPSVDAHNIAAEALDRFLAENGLVRMIEERVARGGRGSGVPLPAHPSQ